MNEVGYQPIVLVKLKELLSIWNKMGLEYTKEYLAFWFFWIFENLTVTGRIERTLLIYDIKDVKVRDLPLKQLFDVAKELE